MLDSDTKSPSNTIANTLSKSLLAFKPRQVLLAQYNPRSMMSASVLKDEKSCKITCLTPELKGTLHQSILQYLHRNGFSKTLKRFQSETQIQSDTWKASSLNLEDIFCKYNVCNVDNNLNTSKKRVLGNDETIKKDSVCTTNEEAITKKKKKKSDKKMVESSKNCDPISNHIIVDELETKPKKKKKTKHGLHSSGQAEEAKMEDKKKKSSIDENGSIQPDSSTKVKKSSKKRKRSHSDENENLASETTIAEESKRQKIQTLKEEKSKKDSIEPKTVNAFQRVKIDQVEFAHEKLQDNSYWAKDGATIGYGAKAQEVLGQVRGRDFRHEKTKKKRGSYRGGLIDLQSHSVKFNYPDEE